jgi:hypothetical protein
MRQLTIEICVQIHVAEKASVDSNSSMQPFAASLYQI